MNALPALEVPDPIFIVGAPRSGTTLLRAMLNRHPDIALCDETYFFYYVYSRQRAFGNLRDIANRRRVVERYMETDRVRRLRLDPEPLRETLIREAEDYGKLFVALMRAYATAQGKRRYGEKTPQHAMHAAQMCDLYPECRLIHLVRDPRAVVGSLMRMPWGAGNVAANARTWRDCTSAVEACSGRPQFLRVHYEALVEDPERELRRICEFAGEDYSAAMLETEPDAQADRWWFERAQKAVSKDRLEKWREELSARDVSVVEWIAGDVMEPLGYAREAPAPSFAVRAGATLREGLGAVANRVRNLPRLWYHWVQPTRLAAEEARIDRHRSEGVGLNQVH